MVYVDNMQAPYRGMIMCHMMADTHEELVTMADRIGVARKWIQYPGTPYEHFDICLAKRRKAVAAGAREVTGRELARLYLPGCQTPGTTTPGSSASAPSI